MKRKVRKKKSILLIMVFLIGCFVCACGKEDSITSESLVEDTASTEETKSVDEEAAEQWEKGYELPVGEHEEKEAENDCRVMMERIYDIYKDADKGTASNVVLNDETILEMQKNLMETEYPVAASVTYSNMGNYESVDFFLEDCKVGKRGSVVIYEIYDDGGIGRKKFDFDGTDMYVVSARSVWIDNDTPGISCIFYTRIKDWSYTDKGWFCYELCVPEPPEVSEVVNGNVLIRVKPQEEKNMEIAGKYLLPIG